MQPSLFAPEITPSGLLFRSGSLADAMPLIMAHHYSQRRTADPMFVFLWETVGGEAKAAAVFTSPINRFFGKGSIELSRLVRTPDMRAPLSQFLALCMRWLRKHSPLLFCLSYAEESAGHHGGIYQAANFIHVGEATGSTMYRNSDGKVVSGRSLDQCSPAYKASFSPFRTGRKFLYVLPLNESRESLLARFGWSALPFPKPSQEIRS
jgi:hypothetical protein